MAKTMSNSEMHSKTSPIAPSHNLFRSEQIEKLSETDPRRELFNQLRTGDIEVGDSTSRGQLLAIIQESCPAIRYTDLPVELASAILSSQHEGIMAMLRGWAESIEHNAKEDKEASLKSREQAEMLKREQEAKSLLSPILLRAVNIGVLSESAAQEIRDRAGFKSQNPQAIESGSMLNQEELTSANGPKLQEPETTGVQLRASED